MHDGIRQFTLRRETFARHSRQRAATVQSRGGESLGAMLSSVPHLPVSQQEATETMSSTPQQDATETMSSAPQQDATQTF